MDVDPSSPLTLEQSSYHTSTILLPQLTDVDPEFRKAPTSELAEQLHLRAQEQMLLQSTEQDFYDESLEVRVQGTWGEDGCNEEPIFLVDTFGCRLGKNEERVVICPHPAGSGAVWGRLDSAAS